MRATALVRVERAADARQLARLTKMLVVLLLLGQFAAATSGAAVSAPTFENYPASVAAPKVSAPADLKSHRRARQYRTLIERADADAINFAGAFTATRIGCGTSCASLVIVDRRTGRLHFFPDPGVLSWSGADGADDTYGFTFRADSRLLRACGAYNEVGPLMCRYYEWTEAGPKLVAERPWGRRLTGR